jgi:hypothetical protein
MTSTYERLLKITYNLCTAVYGKNCQLAAVKQLQTSLLELRVRSYRRLYSITAKLVDHRSAAAAQEHRFVKQANILSGQRVRQDYRDFHAGRTN